MTKDNLEAAERRLPAEHWRARFSAWVQSVLPVATVDWFHAEALTKIDMSAYAGDLGDPIRIQTDGDRRAQQVAVWISQITAVSPRRNPSDMAQGQPLAGRVGLLPTAARRCGRRPPWRAGG
ncbi:MAG: hypothetical protein AB1505_20610 [Candidatus Latescibacterota bacterium]